MSPCHGPPPSVAAFGNSDMSMPPLPSASHAANASRIASLVDGILLTRWGPAIYRESEVFEVAVWGAKRARLLLVLVLVCLMWRNPCGTHESHQQSCSPPPVKVGSYLKSCSHTHTHRHTHTDRHIHTHTHTQPTGTRQVPTARAGTNIRILHKRKIARL